MTGPTWICRFIRRTYNGRGYRGKTIPLDLVKPPSNEQFVRPFYGIEDLMSFLYTKPETVRTPHELKLWVTDYVKNVMRPSAVNAQSAGVPLRKYIICFDRWTPPAKSIVCHTTRDADVEPLDSDTLWIDDSRPQSTIPNGSDWIRFLKTRSAVKRQLFPVLYNAFINDEYFRPLPGELLILHGLPGKSEYHDVPIWNRDPMGNASVQVVLPCPCPITPEMEQADPWLFQRIWLIEGRETGTHREEWVDARNNIGEADLAIVFYDQWFCNENCIVRSIDCDTLSILLLYTQERRRGDGQFRNNFYWWKRSTDDIEADDDPLRKSSDKSKSFMEWYDMNALWEEIRKDSRFTNEGVQNPIVTFVALVIMAGNDFFAGPNKNFLPDVGTERFVWPAFAENARQFSHMFQLSWVLEPDCRALRHVVVDRDAFVDFAHHCYVFKHGEQAKKRYNSNTLESIEQLLTDREENRVKGVRKKLAKITEEEEKAKLEAKLALRPANSLVDTERLRVFAAHLDFCLNYWFNGYQRLPFFVFRFTHAKKVPWHI